MKTNRIVAGVVGVLVLGGVFYGGMRYGEAQGGSTRMSQGGNMMFRNFGGQMGQGGQRAMGGAVVGEILSKDATGITVKLRDGGSRIVFTSASTTISKMTETALEALTVGDAVLVQGSANQDGSITARSIELMPAGNFQFGGGNIRGGR